MDKEIWLERSKHYGFAGIAFLGWLFWVFIAVQLAIIVFLVQMIWELLLGKIFGFLGPSLSILVLHIYRAMTRTFIPIAMRFAGLEPPQELEYLHINRLPFYILKTIRILSKPNNITFALGCLLPFYLLMRYAIGIYIETHPEPASTMPVPEVTTVTTPVTPDPTFNPKATDYE